MRELGGLSEVIQEIDQLPTPNFQLPRFTPGSYWELGVGSWELTVRMSVTSVAGVADLPERARSVATTADKHAEEGDRNGQLSRPVVDALHRERLLAMWVPQSLGGAELDVLCRRVTGQDAGRLAEQVVAASENLPRRDPGSEFVAWQAGLRAAVRAG